MPNLSCYLLALFIALQIYIPKTTYQQNDSLELYKKKSFN